MTDTDVNAALLAIARDLTLSHADDDLAAVHERVLILVTADDAMLQRGDPAVPRAMLDAAAALRRRGALDAAAALLVKGINALGANPATAPQELVAPLYQLLTVHRARGDDDGVSQAAVSIIGIADRIDGPIDGSAAAALRYFSRELEQVGWVEPVPALLRHVDRHLADDADVDAHTMLAWLQQYAAALIRAGAHAELRDVCRRGIDAAAHVPPERQGDVVVALVTLASAARLAGDRPCYETACERAVAFADLARRTGAPDDATRDAAEVVACHNLGLAHFDRRTGGDIARAETLLQRALDLVVRGGRAGSLAHAQELGTLGNVALARGAHDRAAELLRDAAAIYESAPDRSDAEYSDFLVDLGKVQLARGHPTEALPPLRRALALRESAAESAARRADALSELATAHFEAGELAAARLHYERALDLRAAAG